MENFIISEILTQFEFSKKEDFKVRAIILKSNYDFLPKSYSQCLCGKNIEDWVANSVKQIETIFVNYNNKDDPIELSKKYIKDEDYTVVLFDSTPLIKEKTILELLDYTQTKRLDICFLPKGFIFFSKSVKNNTCFMTAEPNFIDKNEFFQVKDLQSFLFVKDKLNTNILLKHINKGIVIEDLKSTFIDADVKIEEGVIVEPFNIIKGQSIIKKNTILKSNNFILNCEIGENCKVSYSELKNTVIKNNSNIGPFQKIGND